MQFEVIKFFKIHLSYSDGGIELLYSERGVAVNILILYYSGGVHKGNAIKAVLQSLHLKKEEFMAFGDAMNDLPMFAEAGLTVAMANAAEEIQASCDIVTADYMDDGVAKAIQRYIL